jgi:hypothetical protein
VKAAEIRLTSSVGHINAEAASRCHLVIRFFFPLQLASLIEKQ